jgi:hypothetical protein
VLLDLISSVWKRSNQRRKNFQNATSQRNHWKVLKREEEISQVVSFKQCSQALIFNKQDYSESYWIYSIKYWVIQVGVLGFWGAIRNWTKMDKKHSSTLHGRPGAGTEDTWETTNVGLDEGKTNIAYTNIQMASCFWESLAAVPHSHGQCPEMHMAYEWSIAGRTNSQAWFAISIQENHHVQWKFWFWVTRILANGRALKEEEPRTQLYSMVDKPSLFTKSNSKFKFSWAWDLTWLMPKMQKRCLLNKRGWNYLWEDKPIGPESV